MTNDTPSKHPAKPRPANGGTITTSFLISLSLQLGAAVAVPTVFLAIGGNALDRRLGDGSTWLFVGLILGFLLSMAAVYRIARAAQRRIDPDH